MNRHLTDKELNGYLHQTLTDAQRENMDLHLDACSRCREQIAAAKSAQRRIHYALMDELRQTRPANMRFSQIAPQVIKQRRWSTIRFYGKQLLTNVAVLGMVASVVMVIFAFMQSSYWQAISPTTAVSTILAKRWDDVSMYRQSLIPSEQTAVDQYGNAPIYHMALTLPRGLSVIRGEQEVRYINQTERPLEGIYFQLTPNLTNHQMFISKVKVNGQSVAIPPAIEEKPSLLRVPLTEPLPPGQQVIIYMAFELRLGETRTALNGTIALANDVLTLANFHPTIVVNRENQWQVAQPVHGNPSVPETSFYLVQVTAPSDYSVVASGLEIGQKIVDNQQVVTFAAGPIEQFALVANGRYMVALSQMVGDTKVTSYAYAEHLTSQARAALDDAVAVLQNLNERYGTYPFAYLEVVGTPTLNVANPVAAYPGLILTDMNKYESIYRFGERSLESAVTFGVVQQWFGRILGSNHFQFPWLAESLSEFVTQATMADSHGQQAAKEQPGNYFGFNKNQQTMPIGLPIYAYTLSDYQAIMYGRGPDFLEALHQIMGEDRWQLMLHDYYQSYKWSSLPNPEAFQQIAETHCTCDLDPLFADWVKLKQ